MNHNETETVNQAATQAKAARILADLTTRQIDARLPVASWHLSAYTTDLSGNVTAHEYDRDGNLYHDDKTSIENVRAWGRSFAVEPRYEEWETKPGTAEIGITIRENGITINIWALIATIKKTEQK